MFKYYLRNGELKLNKGFLISDMRGLLHSTYIIMHPLKSLKILYFLAPVSEQEDDGGVKQL